MIPLSKFEEKKMILAISGLIFLAGCIGGLTNSIVSGEMQLPHHDKKARIYRPGWVGTVLVGGVAAAASWGLYGPFAQSTMIGTGAVAAPALRVGEFFGAMVIGFGGGRWLSAEVGRLTASRERDALQNANKMLAQTLRRSRAASVRRNDG